jgi:opacity protein-like surface antigen
VLLLLRLRSVRQRQRLSLGVLLVTALAWPPRTAPAQANPSSQPPGQALRAASVPAPPWSNRGHWDFGLQVGYGVENAIPNNISHVNLLIVQPQLGLIVRDFHRGPLQRFEIVAEGLLGNAVHPGGHLWGNSLFFRFDGKGRTNFVPFLDLGAGVMHTTLATRVPEVSGRLQFMPQAGVGLQYFFNPQRALVFEYRYFHMSNAGIEQPNDGFNGSMLTIGFRWLRRPRPASDAGAGR